MLSLSKTSRNDPHGAQNNLYGSTSNGATWYETITLTDTDGNQLTGVASDAFQLQLRADPKDDSAILTLTTADSTLTVTVGASSTTMLINTTQASVSDLDGDYTADIVQKAASDSRLTHYAHGLVSFRKAPIAF